MMNYDFAKMEKLTFRETDLSGAILTRSDIIECNLENVKFVNADLRGTKFIQCNLKNVDFSNANLNGVKFAGSDLTGAKGLDRYFIDNKNSISTTIGEIHKERW